MDIRTNGIDDFENTLSHTLYDCTTGDAIRQKVSVTNVPSRP